jgi:Mg-chelatase subunit ChlD
VSVNDVEDAPGTPAQETTAQEAEWERRWRLVLGKPSGLCAGGGGAGSDGQAPEEQGGSSLSAEEQAMDAALAALYNKGDEDGAGRGAGLGGSAPRVARWLGDIRGFFPSSVVRVMQQDALDRLGLQQMLLEPEMMQAVEPDVHLVGTLLTLKDVMPQSARESARAVVRTVVDDLEQRLRGRAAATVQGALDRSARTHRPRRIADIDFPATIRRNLQHYLPETGTVVPRNLVGYGRRSQGIEREVVLALDQSGSMASSVVYGSVFGAVLASLRSLKTSMVVFDTSVVDLTEQLSDPVEVLFGTQLGGGTDINRAVAYCQQLITRPTQSVFVLISDLLEGGIREEMLQRIGAMTAAGVQCVVLLALSDDGAPSYDRTNAAALAAMGVPAFACTPDAFPELMAAALQGEELTAWVDKYQSEQGA